MFTDCIKHTCMLTMAMPTTYQQHHNKLDHHAEEKCYLELLQVPHGGTTSLLQVAQLRLLHLPLGNNLVPNLQVSTENSRSQDSL